MGKVIKAVLALALIACLVLLGLYIKMPEVLPDKIVQFLDEASGEVQQEQMTFDPAYYPYYGMLTKKEQAIYCRIYEKAGEFRTGFFPGFFVKTDEVDRAMNALYYDHPELFWLDHNYSYQYYQNGMCVRVILQFNETYGMIEQSLVQFAARADEIVEAAEKLESDYEKEKYVHDVLVQSVTYTEDSRANQSAYSALVDGKTLCAGYARAYQYLMTRLGIPTYYCTGYSEGDDHGWNIVLLEDGYYNVDVTWDDSTSSYDYFNRTDADFDATHIRTGDSLNLPACNGTIYR